MKSLTSVLLVVLLILQYPLWLGKGGWIKVWDLNRQIEQLERSNQQAEARNAVLDAEVRDLKDGTAAIEERARTEFGMIKPNEIFYQIQAKSAPPAISAVSAVPIDTSP